MSTSSNTEVADPTMTLSGQAHKDNSVNGVDELQVQRRYDEERTKRIRDEGDKQYVDISLSENFKKFGEDPWINPSTFKDAREMFPDNRCQMFILGAGLGGILYAVRMIQAGFRPEDIRIVDRAGGFGGTWYHNRYPGLKCDIESYSYLPLLEETGYVPKYRYSSGEEIRNYANLIAEKYNLVNSAAFLTKAEALVWNDAAKSWDIEISQTFPGKPSQNLNIQSQFVCTVPGFSHWPKFPDLPGVLDYQGDIFHTSRWNYSVTGGSEADPSLTKLRDKRVAIIGTGATAVQVVPQLAEWAKHLFVVQRTPSAVDERNNHATDPSWFKKEVATSSSWQRERLQNFHQHFTTGERPKANLVNDNWKHSSLVALTGDPAGPKTLEEFPAYLQLLYSLDLSHQAKLRQRVVDIVQDEKTAEGLKAWYPSWCKRPCFHDEYLTTFNRANVTLVDTEGRGPDGLTGKSIVVGDQKYKVDVIVFATGFRGPSTGSYAEKGNLTISGLNGVSMSEQWAAHGPSTLHGVLDHNFPNLFLSSPWQAANSPNFLYSADTMAKHSAYILSEAKRKANGRPFAVSPTKEAAEDWGNEVAMCGVISAAGLGCTPGYFNNEGAMGKLSLEGMGKMIKGGFWGKGIEHFIAVIEKWREGGEMRGLEVRT